jgi:hypothetical protein
VYQAAVVPKSSQNRGTLSVWEEPPALARLTQADFRSRAPRHPITEDSISAL